MTRRSLFAGIFIFLILLAGCKGVIDLDQDNHLKSCPAEEGQILEVEESIEIQFPESVNAYSVEQICSVRNIKGSVDCRYLWEDKKVLRIEPLADLIPGLEYTLQLKGLYDNTRGISRKADLIIPFYYTSDQYTPLEILKIIPARGEEIGSGTGIIVEFNREPDQALVMKNFSLSPDSEYDFSFSGATLSIVPEEAWENLTQYTLKFSDEAVDPSWESMFFVQDGHSIPQVTLMGAALKDYTTGYPFKSIDSDVLAYEDALRISFSEEMDQQTVEDAFSLTPPLGGTLHWDGNYAMVYVPSEGWQMNTVYTVSLGQEASSLHGIKLETDWEENFQPQIPALNLDSLECVTSGLTLTEYDTSLPEDLPTNPVSPYDITFRLTFSEPFSTDLEKQMAQNQISIYEIFSSDGNPRAASFSWVSDYTLTIMYAGFYASADRDHYYICEINSGTGGIRNDRGSYMESGVAQLFRSHL